MDTALENWRRRRYRPVLSRGMIKCLGLYAALALEPRVAKAAIVTVGRRVLDVMDAETWSADGHFRLTTRSGTLRQPTSASAPTAADAREIRE
jgi:hypothetical protein